MKKKTKILIEIEQVRISYQPNNQLKAFCQKCEAMTDFLTDIDAAVLIGNHPFSDFHTKIMPNKELIFCLKSILEKINFQ